jgi:hypothetical protein
MTLRLIALRVDEPSSCIAEFDRGGDSLVTKFEVEDHDGISLASCEPDVFRDFGGSAEEQRAIVAAVVAFCRARKGLV